MLLLLLNKAAQIQIFCNFAHVLLLLQRRLPIVVCIGSVLDAAVQTGAKGGAEEGCRLSVDPPLSLHLSLYLSLTLRSAVCPPIWTFFYSIYGGGPVIARGFFIFCPCPPCKTVLQQRCAMLLQQRFVCDTKNQFFLLTVTVSEKLDIYQSEATV